MKEYMSVPTSPEVWAVIRARHPEMVVFGSFSNPNGTEFGGNGSKGEMSTSYGFNGGDYPVIEANTKWDIDPANPANRDNKVTEYYLCLPIEDES